MKRKLVIVSSAMLIALSALAQSGTTANTSKHTSCSQVCTTKGKCDKSCCTKSNCDKSKCSKDAGSTK